MHFNDTYALIEYSVKKLKDAGFNLAVVSWQSEACYYQYPGINGLLRVATHQYSRSANEFTETPVLACLTLTENHVIKTEANLNNMIYMAVGKYIMADGKGIASWRQSRDRNQNKI